MTVLYSLSIFIYDVLLRLVALFNPKAKQFVEGRINWIQKLHDSIKPDASYVWVHCASLGEFEQGRPIIEEIKKEYPDLKILLTFFSPSGYEIRKQYEYADVVFYLPLDTKFNAEFFLSIVKPKAVVFIKYEFWHYYLDVVNKLKIPLYLVSGIFRENQIQFKSYGTFFKKSLFKFTHLFVQDEASKKLLNNIGIDSVTVSGDTRFDRVLQTISEDKEFAIVENFKNDQLTIMYGSTWEEDEAVIISTINESSGTKHIIAPHEIKEATLHRIENTLSKKVIRYTRLNEQMKLEDYDVLIIDTIGMLAYIYKYTDIAYVGGAFGKGLHNILEAATYGKPIVFGPNYLKFKEARDLIIEKGAFSIQNKEEYTQLLASLIGNEYVRQAAGAISKAFTIKNQGATEHVMAYFKMNKVL